MDTSLADLSGEDAHMTRTRTNGAMDPTAANRVTRRNPGPATSSRPLGDPEIYKLQDAVSFWQPAVDHAEFCYKRRPGDVVGVTHKVTLASRSGNRPVRYAQEATLVMREWDEKYCFWTLSTGKQTFIVYLHGSDTKFGPHWKHWLGVKERYEDKAVAFPLEVSH